MKLPSLEDVRKQPAFPTTIWQLEPHQTGLLTTGANRGGPYKISWEVHGDGPVKIILLGGLGVTRSDWQAQTLYFGHQKGTEYSLLLVDNLGMGDSDKPWMLTGYSTKGMAQDAIDVADHLGWTAPRQLHVGGGSMGGMIAQHFGSLVPNRIATLTPWSTAAEIEATGGLFEMLSNSWNMLRPKSLQTDIQDTASGCFPEDWLRKPDMAQVPQEGTIRCTVPDGGYKLFDNNYARFAAQEIIKSKKQHFTRTGFWMQTIAAGKHGKDPQQLKELGDQVGRDRIMVLHGKSDQMMAPELANRLIKGLQPGNTILIDGMGHAPIVQNAASFNEALEQQIRNGERLSGRHPERAD